MLLATILGSTWSGCVKDSAPPPSGAAFDGGTAPELDASMDGATGPDDATTPEAEPEAAPVDATGDDVAIPEASVLDTGNLDTGGPEMDATPDAPAEATTSIEAGAPDVGVDAPLVCVVDGMKDGEETDVDCGGAPCDAQMRVCADGKQCLIGGDCLSQVCTGDVCQVPTCTDGVRNGNETDVDCGGPLCDGQGHTCADGKKCLTAPDCTDKLCGPNFTCAFPSCTDGVQDGGETGVDCGNQAVTGCNACPVGQGCNVASDCTSMRCASNICQPATCSDGIQDGGESDVDCGAVCVLKLCSTGKHCFTSADCQSMVCLANGTCM